MQGWGGPANKSCISCAFVALAGGGGCGGCCCARRDCSFAQASAPLWEEGGAEGEARPGRAAGSAVMPEAAGATGVAGPAVAVRGVVAANAGGPARAMEVAGAEMT